MLLPDTKSRLLTFLLTVSLVLVFSQQSRAAGDEGSLERHLVREAPKIMERLRDKGYRNVGVLKFRVDKGRQSNLDRTGTLNMNLADRLELALILANDARRPIGITRDASSVAAGISGADHRSAEGRQKLFAGKYPLAWGSEKVQPDAFLIGIVKLTEQLGEMEVGIAAMDKNGQMEKLCQFKTRPTASDLSEAGESFVLRGVFDQGSVEIASAKSKPEELTLAKREELASIEAVKEALEVKHSPKPADHPLFASNKEAPIGLKIYYDNREVPYEFRDGCAFIPEPRQGQKVSFKLVRKTTNNITYGVVLKVNGENTIYRQRLKDCHCRMWIMPPNSPDRPIVGFQLDGNKAQEFRVLSPQESSAREMDYGRDVGTISMVVFRNRPTNLPEEIQPVDVQEREAEDLFAIVTRGALPADPGPTLAQFRQQLEADKPQLRGLIAEGQEVDQKTVRVQFLLDPIPVMSGVVTYYHK